MHSGGEPCWPITGSRQCRRGCPSLVSPPPLYIVTAQDRSTRTQRNRTRGKETAGATTRPGAREREQAPRSEQRERAKARRMGGAPAPPPCAIVGPRRAAAHSFRLPRHGRRKVHVVRLGGPGARGRGLGRGLRLRQWLRRAAWRLAELCVAALSGHPGAPPSAAHPPWTGVEPCFAAPFVPVARMKRAAAQA